MVTMKLDRAEKDYRMNGMQSTGKGLRILVTLAILLLAATGSSFAAEMVTNGNFNGSTSWTFSTTTYDGTNTNTADGSGSGTISASGRNTQSTDTIIQTVSIGAGSSIASAADVAAYVKHSSTTVPSASRSITIQLRYLDTSTVEIFSNSTFADGTPWTAVANNTATAFPLTLAQDVDQIIVTLDTRDGNDNAAASQLWADDISITYTAAAAPDTLSVTANTPVASSASPGELDVQMQYLQVDSDNANDGQVEITTVTVDDLGTAGAGDIDNLKVHIDDNTNFGDGVLGTATVASWGGTSTPVDMTGIGVAARTVTNGTSKYVWVTYDINAATADGTTIQSSVTNIAVNGENGASGTWNANSISIASGPANTLTSCADCHDYPPADATGGRGTPEGAVVGSHGKHSYTCNFCHVVPATETSSDFAHRNGDINMKSGTIGDAGTGDNGAYSRGATFAQTNSPTTGTCSNVDCHYNNVTPQWGVGTAQCDSCHGAPPATGAHAAHYAGKGWTSPDTAGTNCVTCHPDNAGGSHDGAVTVNAGLTYAGGGGSCSSPGGLGCHNDYTTPNWSGGSATCTTCHTAGGVNAADPVSGLHDETPTVSGVIHNPSDANFTGCEDCHTASPSATHWDGTFDAPSVFDAAIGYSTGSPPTCTASACHSDGGAWSRKWHENSDLSDGSECAGCHGDWTRGWNTGVTHRTDADPQGTHGTGTNYECKDCHALEAATGYTFTSGTTDWGTEGSNHGNGNITLNSNGTSFARGTGGSSGLSGCSACHNAYDGTDGALNQHSFVTTSWTLETVSGDTINAGCDSCHGGSGTYYPNGSTYPDRAGRHAKHMTELAAAIGYGAGPWTDAQQKHMCEYCHNDAAGVGGGGHNDNVSPADVGDFNPIWDLSNPPATIDSGSAFTSADGSCASIDCHNNKSTGTGTYGWRDAGTVTCTMCHTAGGNGGAEIADPTSGLHDETPTVSGTIHNPSDANFTGCEDCHTASPSATHRDGTADTPSTFDAAIGYTSGTPPTCANSCHADAGRWSRKWHENSDLADGTECAGCHGTFATGFTTGVNARHQTTTTGDADGDIEANHDGTNKCVRCHAYDGADTYGHKWATHHRDSTIQISDQVSLVDNGTTVGCSACHSAADGTADEGHEFDETPWGRALVAGPVAGCSSCHDSGAGGAPVITAASPHSTDAMDLAIGGAAWTCADCHTAHNSGTIEIPNGTWADGSAIFNYTANGENGISLGGARAAGATEAEICWNCHSANGISEWGLNTDTNGAAANYDFGSLDQPNWIGATWTSGTGIFTYKTGAIQSTHAADSAGASGMDLVGEIRCSYCHDVHDTDGPTGKPYLRGNWVGNPYPEDGAPQAGTVYPDTDSCNDVPRCSPNHNTAGGYQIDQNNGSPNVWTPEQFGGLCEKCHGNNDGTFSPTEIGTLDQYSSSDWVSGYNGHANAVKGGPGPGSGAELTARNIFDARGGTAAGCTEEPVMQFRNASGIRPGWDCTPKYGFRGPERPMPGLGTGHMYSTGQPKKSQVNVWGPDLYGSTTDANFHQFTCSKCHNPHASRLPRLMITNCLDTKHNTWDNDNTTKPLNPYTGINNNRPMSQWTSAQNCHRRGGDDPDDARAGEVAAPDAGWNTITPW